MKSNTRRAFAASLLAIGGALAATSARAREWGGRRDGGDGDHEHRGDGGQQHQNNNGGGGGGGQQHHEGWRDGGGQQQNFKQGDTTPRHEFRQQGSGGQGGGGQDGGAQGGGAQGGGRQWSRPSAPQAPEHHDAIVQNGGQAGQGGGDRTRSWQGGGDRGRSWQNGGGQPQGGDGRWQGGGARSFQGGSNNNNSWQGGGERRQVWNGGGGGNRDWIRDHGADHNWNGGGWDGRNVRRINQGGYFNNSHARIVGRYFNRRAIYFSSGGFYGAWRYPWRVGYVLPGYVNYWPIPYELYDELPPCPYGYDYCQVDGGAILLLSLITGLIIDAILFL